MKWRKAPPELIETFDAVFPGNGARRRPMFGYPAGFMNGNMFGGLWQEQLVLRLAEADRDALLRTGGRPFEPMPGRPMKEYVSVPGAVLADRGQLGAWMERARSYAASLPPKKPPVKSRQKGPAKTKPGAKAKTRTATKRK